MVMCVRGRGKVCVYPGYEDMRFKVEDVLGKWGRRGRGAGGDPCEVANHIIPTELDYVVELYGFQPVLKTKDLIAELRDHFR